MENIMPFSYITSSDQDTYQLESLLYEKYSKIVEAAVNTDKLSKEEFFRKVFDSAFELIPEAQKGSYYECVGDKFIPVFAKGYDMDILKKLEFDKNNVFIGFEWIKDSGRINSYETYIEKREDSLYSETTLEAFKQLGTYADFASLYAPIQVAGVNTGLLCLENFQEKMFSKSSKILLKLYVQLISNFYTQKVYHEKEKKMFNDIIDALVSAIEINDKYTQGHAKRVTEISRKIAKRMGLSNEQMNNIEAAAVLHDIGKIGIPSGILTKPGQLTEEEYELVKKHPANAKKILEHIGDFSDIVNYTYMHHEHFDGSGYPQGLRGNDIPVEAQIIQVADAFDAMTSERSYREAIPVDTAIKIIESESGKQFSPSIVYVIIDLYAHNML